ncbi:hypothetical protein ACQUQU_09625 [Thalassolituus sp. LLYu03]|uniref:hypothetical protein n=1 Tax=Thalassolituus sp. LLYu03 TaxID=3421656 RepID=UPI003D2B3B23
MDTYLSELMQHLSERTPLQVDVGNINKQNFPWINAVAGYERMLGSLGVHCDVAMRDRIIENYIYRDLIFLRMAQFSGRPFSLHEVANSEEQSFARQETLYLGSHDFFQVITPLLLARAGTAVFPFVDSPLNMVDPVVAALARAVYENGQQYLSGGRCIKVDQDNRESWRSHFEAALQAGSAIYAAIDQFPAFMRVHDNSVVSGKYGQYRLVSGAISQSMAAGYKCVYVKVVQMGGRYCIRTKGLTGDTVDAICSQYVAEVERDFDTYPDGWEGILRLLPSVPVSSV